MSRTCAATYVHPSLRHRSGISACACFNFNLTSGDPHCCTSIYNVAPSVYKVCVFLSGSYPPQPNHSTTAAKKVSNLALQNSEFRYTSSCSRLSCVGILYCVVVPRGVLNAIDVHPVLSSLSTTDFLKCQATSCTTSQAGAGQS